MTFFELAEKNRRWNPFNDVPWDELDPESYSANAALNAETFVGVESYLPDYVSQGINCVRSMFGQAWFQCELGIRGVQTRLCSSGVPRAVGATDGPRDARVREGHPRPPMEDAVRDAASDDVLRGRPRAGDLHDVPASASACPRARRRRAG